ncbi:peptidoglycan-binding domain-containing protein [Lysobacter enzymogenes]|uniref:Peptidoglycan-binding protein n=1 Tax=Lysobacter enzymogenes TaxID=69 RepID=A0A3N2RKP7_LYSEN|nr:peptidoglycan-binding domain-containing protein [Lysobacter enzymogenes]ROU07979.1 peptidoglycan-binding protein [Lysobacter enzymogenes]
MDGRTTHYRVIQLGAPKGAGGVQSNEVVTDFDSLVTHHPGNNRNARIENGLVVGGERTRQHALIGGEIQEIEIVRNGNTFQGLKPDQVLLKKDFMLEAPGQANPREVDVPSPVAGVVGRVSHAEGLVDIYDRKGGDVIVRVRHMRDIELEVNDAVAYGQSLGTQHRVATEKVHVHMEMDTRYYRQFENYVSDLTEGRLPVEAVARLGVEPRPVADDGVLRLGESSSRIRDLQNHLNGMGYVGADGQALTVDGVYRLNMQRAVLDYQREQCLPQTGDIGREMLQAVPARTPEPFDPALSGIPAQGLPHAPMPHPFGTGPDDRPCAPPTPQQIEDAAERRRPLDPVFSAAPPSISSDPLVQSIRERLPQAFASHGAVPPDADLDRIAAGLAVECCKQGIERPDHIVVGNPAADGSGRHVFAVVGDLRDPASHRVDVAGQAAAQVPVEASLRKLDALQASTPALVQADQAQEQQKASIMRV